MTLADHIEAYAAVLVGLVWPDDLYRAIDALLARDATSGWWRAEAEA